ncbi:MAG: hypothetical protein K8S15_13765 [Candidatus Aegiribacteria sp.]|nr:hypothetical protein [Candidatus Aegiribacteria sp.]
MNRIIVLLSGVFLFLSAFITGCGEEVSIQYELEMVPGLCFLHVHIGDEMNIGLIPDEINEFVPMWLCDSLHTRGSFGVSLLGINLTDFSPQLLFLSREITTDEMLQLGTSGFNCRFEENPEACNLIDDRGSMIGSIACRDGWTCLVTGSGADRTAGRWLELELEESLASDIDLVSISESDADLTVLISHNSIAFVSVIPTGMLSRAEISMLSNVKSLIQTIDPRALRISLDISSEDPQVTHLELQLVRDKDNVTTFSADFSDTELTPEDLLQIIRDGGILY